MENKTSAPAWNIDSEYPSMTSPKFERDKAFIESNIAVLTQFSESIASLDLNTDATLDLFTKMILLNEKCDSVGYNLGVYVGAMGTIDVTRTDVMAMESQLGELRSRLSQSAKVLENFLMTVDDSFIQRLLLKPGLEAFKFIWLKNREQRPHRLSNEEEILLEGLSVTGHTAWMTLSNNLIGAMECKITVDGVEKTVGLSEAAAAARGNSEANCKSGWQAVYKAWDGQKESAAAILNALAGWRIEVSKKRSRQKPMNFLTQALFDNRIEESTLNALMECCRKNKEQLWRAPRAMAKVAGKTRLDPWDLNASCPVLSKNTEKSIRSYDQGLTLVKTAFEALNPAMAEFADLMNKNAWVDARVLPTKSTGGYCTEFSESREPRIFVTYQGSENDITTLAHEMGHAYHYWVMRDINRVAAQYPSTLAETASVFAEQALRDHLSNNSKTLEDQLEAGWSEMESILGYLIDIPSRFEFEKTFHEKRQTQTLSANELSDLMEVVRGKWYGDTVSANDKLFWASKLHFSISGSGFYNFPYAFGYLFAMSLYARRKEQGPSFNKTYTEILRDTGRMTAEDLIQKHLGEDIRQPQFWQKSIDLVIEKIERFENILQKKSH